MNLRNDILTISAILFLCFFLNSILSFGQAEYFKIDKVAITVPDSLFDYKEITSHLTKNLDTDRDRARAIYVWIAHNIKYDVAQVDSSKGFSTSQEFIDDVLKYRAGICQHYAELFHAMVQFAGLRSYLIGGYTRDVNGKVADSCHAWNGVYIDSSYYLMDVTWDAGYVANDKYFHEFRDIYFLMEPKDFIKNHMPFDPLWQFLDNPIKNDDFISRDYSKLKTKGTFAIKDSLDAYENFDELTKLEATNRRIILNGMENNLVLQEVEYNTNRIISMKYNAAIETLNKGVEDYNLYVFHRNKLFRKPKLDDSAIRELIDNPDYAISAASISFSSLWCSNNELNALIIETRKKIVQLKYSIEEQKQFVERYLNTWRPFRIFFL